MATVSDATSPRPPWFWALKAAPLPLAWQLQLLRPVLQSWLLLRQHPLLAAAAAVVLAAAALLQARWAILPAPPAGLHPLTAAAPAGQPRCLKHPAAGSAPPAPCPTWREDTARLSTAHLIAPFAPQHSMHPCSRCLVNVERLEWCPKVIATSTLCWSAGHGMPAVLPHRLGVICGGGCITLQQEQLAAPPPPPHTPGMPLPLLFHP